MQYPRWGLLSSLGAGAKLEMESSMFRNNIPPMLVWHRPLTSPTPTCTSHRSGRQMAAVQVHHLGQHGKENPRMGKSHETLPQDHFRLRKHLCGWLLWAEVDLVRGQMSGSVAQSPPLSLPWDCPVGPSVAPGRWGLAAVSGHWRAKASDSLRRRDGRDEPPTQRCTDHHQIAVSPLPINPSYRLTTARHRRRHRLLRPRRLRPPRSNTGRRPTDRPTSPRFLPGRNPQPS